MYSFAVVTTQTHHDKQLDNPDGQAWLDRAVPLGAYRRFLPRSFSSPFFSFLLVSTFDFSIAAERQFRASGVICASFLCTCPLHHSGAAVSRRSKRLRTFVRRRREEVPILRSPATLASASLFTPFPSPLVYTLVCEIIGGMTSLVTPHSSSGSSSSGAAASSGSIPTTSSSAPGSSTRSFRGAGKSP